MSRAKRARHAPCHGQRVAEGVSAPPRTPSGREWEGSVTKRVCRAVGSGAGPRNVGRAGETGLRPRHHADRHSNSSERLLCLRHPWTGVLGVRCRGGRALYVLSRPRCAFREQPDATRRQVPCQVGDLRHNRARRGRGDRRTFDGTPRRDCPSTSPGGSSASPSKRRGHRVSVNTSIR